MLINNINQPIIRGQGHTEINFWFTFLFILNITISALYIDILGLDQKDSGITKVLLSQ